MDVFSDVDEITSLLQTKIGLFNSTETSLHAALALHPTITKKVVVTSGPLIPINSAGEHTGVRKTIDVILLCAALVLPIVLFFVIRQWEKIHDRARTTAKSESSPEGSQDKGHVSRLGSSYQLKMPIEEAVSLTGALNRKPQENKEADEGTVLQNILAGFSTAMAALPDAISFSFITGVSPLNGIWAGCIMGISASMCGGRPGMISSASAATAVVLAHVSLDASLGMGPMALCVFIVGILQIIAAALRLSRFITMIPHSVMLGFVNGLAIVMIKAQLRQYHLHGDGPWVEKELIVSMTITGLFAMAAAWTWARIPVAGKVFPAPLASLVLTAVFAFVLQDVLPRRTLSDVAGAETFRGGFSTMPSWNFPPAGVHWHSGYMWRHVISTAVRFAIVGLLESLMTQALIDQITGTSGSMARECFGQGVGNILSSFFGTQGGCALIAQSLLNVGSGGLSRVSSLTMGITLGLSVFLLAPIMAQIPVAALVGLITLIALNTFAWSSVVLILRVNWIDAVVVVLVTVVTVWQDLCVAVIAGLIINALGFSWNAATRVRVTSEAVDDDTRIFRLRGPLFFGSALNYKMEVNPTFIQEKNVILEFSDSPILDISGSNAVAETRSNLMTAGKNVTLRGLSDAVVRELPHDVVVEPGVPASKDPSIK